MAIIRLRSSASTQDEKHEETLQRTGFWGTQAVGCLFLAQDTQELLFALRSSQVCEPNTWGLWGGAVDEGESPLQALQREVREESGYKGKPRLVKLYTFKDAESGFEYHSYLAVIPSAFTPRLDWESSDYRWVKYGEWPRPLHPGVVEMLRKGGQKAILREVGL